MGMQRGTTRPRSDSDEGDERPRHRQRQSAAAKHLNPFRSDMTNMGPPIPIARSSEAGPSNGHTNGTRSLPPDIELVKPEGNLMYEDDKDWVLEQRTEDGIELPLGSGSKRMPVVREEVVRLVLQGLRDMGYEQSAGVLEAESGYILASTAAKDFEAAILGGRWAEALALLPELGMIEDGPSSPWGESSTTTTPLPAPEQAQFLVAKQKFLEYLELGQQKKALQVLRSEIAPITKDSNVLHDVSAYMMCVDKDDLFARAAWDGAAGSSRRKLLAQLQAFLSPGVMVPERRLATLLDQARQHQAATCAYHSDFEATSLYVDHECKPGLFPTLTTHILADHTDEVWRIEWSPDGMLLASAGKDRQVVIWQLQYQPDSNPAWSVEPLHHLHEHRDPVDVLAWSPDGQTLITGADKGLYMWDTKTGKQKTLAMGTSPHTDTISAIHWRSDGSEFIVSSMDCKVVFYTASGAIIKQWSFSPVQILDFVITPDERHIVATTTALKRAKTDNKLRPSTSARIAEASGPISAATEDGEELQYEPMEHGLIVVRLSDKEIIQDSGDLRCEVTSMKLSWDGKRALLSCNPDQVQLWAIDPFLRHIRSYTGHVQSQFLIRSGFGSLKDRFILSGSEDGHVYAWQSASTQPIQILAGHKNTVNCIAWNPVFSRRIFASCSDDGTIRVWQTPDRTRPTAEEVEEDRKPKVEEEGMVL